MHLSGFFPAFILKTSQCTGFLRLASVLSKKYILFIIIVVVVYYYYKQCIAIEDIHPQAPVHFLVIPKKEIQKLSDTTEEDEQVRNVSVV